MSAGGMRLAFFSGGSALRGLSRQLASKGHDSIHLVSTFDSGGSSAALRRAFAMPAVGDLRNRLLALAEAGQDDCLEFCARRLPAEGDCESLRTELRSLADCAHPAWARLDAGKIRHLQVYYAEFVRRMPAHFDPRKACIGNLILAGGYLAHGRDFAPPLTLLSRLLKVRGRILPIVNESLHLGAELADGRIICGQHRFKELAQPVRRLFLTVHEPDSAQASVCRPPVSPAVADALGSASLICFPMGSFQSSILANLLPAGVGQAVAQSSAPKLFIPNSGADPELCGLDLVAQARSILDLLRADAPDASASALLGHVLLDPKNGCYNGGTGPEVLAGLEALGVRVHQRNLVRADDPACHEPKALLCALEELALVL